MKQIISVLLLLSVISCTETIDIDFNDFDDQYVIEANVSTIDAPLVTITSTIDFDESNMFPGIDGAVVTLTDDMGAMIVLDEISTGVFTKDGYVGQVGRTYTLNIDINGKLFSSVCKIPEQVTMDSLSLEQIVASMWTTIDDADSVYDLYAHFQEPVDEDNYYYFIEYINGEWTRTFLYSDYTTNGVYQDYELHTHDRVLNHGDTITVELRCIDENVYDYLGDIGENNPMNATPTNPNTNIQNAKLGYFSAYTSEFKTLIVP